MKTPCTTYIHRMWRALIAVAFLLLLALHIGVSSSNADDDAKSGYIWLGTGGPAGTYFKVGRKLCRSINRNAQAFLNDRVRQKLECTSAPSGGSAFNVRQLSIGAFTLALVQSDTQYHAYNGSNPHAVQPFRDLRSILALYQEPVQLVVAKGSDIKKFSDIVGKRVNIGNVGSGTRNVMMDLMEQHGVAISDLAEATELTGTEYPRALCDGRLDAYIVVSSVPARQIKSAVSRCGAKMIGLGSEVEEQLVKRAPYYSIVTLPKGSYTNQEKDIKTISVTATLVTSRKVSSVVIYEVVRTLMQNLGYLHEMETPHIFRSPKELSSKGLAAPMHPGAVKYFHENGLM